MGYENELNAWIEKIKKKMEEKTNNWRFYEIEDLLFMITNEVGNMMIAHLKQKNNYFYVLGKDFYRAFDNLATLVFTIQKRRIGYEQNEKDN